MSCRRYDGKAFHTRGPAAVKLPPPRWSYNYETVSNNPIGGPASMTGRYMVVLSS